MTELSFLLELLLEHQLEKPTQTLIRSRIKEIELQPQGRPATQRSPTGQAASTQRILDEMAIEGVTPPHHQPSAGLDQIAQTPAAAAAMAQRAEAIRIATSGVEEKGRRSPRKF